MENKEIEDGTIAATEITKTILGLIDRGINPSSISVAAAGVSIAMLIHQHGNFDGDQIAQGLLNKAKAGELTLFAGLKATNINASDD